MEAKLDLELDYLALETNGTENATETNSTSNETSSDDSESSETSDSSETTSSSTSYNRAEGSSGSTSNSDEFVFNPDDYKEEEEEKPVPLTMKVGKVNRKGVVRLRFNQEAIVPKLGSGRLLQATDESVPLD